MIYVTSPPFYQQMTCFSHPNLWLTLYRSFFFQDVPVERLRAGRERSSDRPAPGDPGGRGGGWGAPWFGAGRVVEGFRKICSWWTSNSWYIFNCRAKRQFVQGCWILGGKQEALRDEMTPTCLMISWNSVCQDLQKSLGGGLFLYIHSTAETVKCP